MADIDRKTRVDQKMRDASGGRKLGTHCFQRFKEVLLGQLVFGMGFMIEFNAKHRHARVADDRAHQCRPEDGWMRIEYLFDRRRKKRAIS